MSGRNLSKRELEELRKKEEEEAAAHVSLYLCCYVSDILCVFRYFLVYY